MTRFNPEVSSTHSSEFNSILTVHHFAAVRPETFTETEKLNHLIEAEWEEEAHEVHREENRIASENGQMDHVKSWIKVVVDGGWQKMSNGHSYSLTSSININQI